MMVAVRIQGSQGKGCAGAASEPEATAGSGVTCQNQLHRAVRRTHLCLVSELSTGRPRLHMMAAVRIRGSQGKRCAPAASEPEATAGSGVTCQNQPAGCSRATVVTEVLFPFWDLVQALTS
jgi:hypothetical protein